MKDLDNFGDDDDIPTRQYTCPTVAIGDKATPSIHTETDSVFSERSLPIDDKDSSAKEAATIS
jgi:hypothetical protein